ncbi:MAG TPA: thioredoxin domain-containing protein [Fimbriimonadaceae bacterium]|nr:thioredoxin domain-containing protein [Fimbriimonadaceae bacterium]
MKIDAGVVLVGIAAISAVGLVGATILRPYRVIGPATVKVPPAELIGDHPMFEGNPNSKLTLVIFMDYECGPCRKEFGEIEEMLKEAPGQIRIVYRNLPLSSVHPYAAEAALAALAARDQGRFWEMHRSLFDARFDSKTIPHLVASLGLDKKRFEHSLATTAKWQLDDDEALAKKCGFEGTPTVVLCKGNTATRLADANDAYAYFK